MLRALLAGTLAAAATRAATRPNIVLILNDDHDEFLGGWTPMNQTRALLGARGATARNWFIHTPVCCPSRAEILTGRYFHNLRVDGPDDGGCMHANLSKVENFSYAAALARAGYVNGYFGKHVNDAPHAPPPGWDCATCYWFANGGGKDAEPGGYLNASFADFDGGAPVGSVDDGYHADGPGYYAATTAGEFGGYTTSVIANKSIAWLRRVAPLDAPFMLTLAPKAPHVPATPAPWYTRGTWIDALPGAPRTPDYNASAQTLAGHHWLIAQQGIITDAQGVEIDELFRDRWRTLLSVDDAVAGVVGALDELGVLDSTYVLLTSDHGYVRIFPRISLRISLAGTISATIGCRAASSTCTTTTRASRLSSAARACARARPSTRPAPTSTCCRRCSRSPAPRPRRAPSSTGATRARISSRCD